MFVKSGLHASYYGEQELRKYDKGQNLWVRVGGLPERSGSMNGWGLAFRALVISSLLPVALRFIMEG
ncbi:hypothetical protein HanPI659440_Chr10g0382251 [Helianthus annuus]|nr:hypothetical protein HanPI659440_Chr10g0382251 [Helianthus annuus]